MHTRSAFTLIELLVVIAIIAVLSVVIILVLNPAELLRQSRDTNRLSDMASLNTAIGIFSADQSTGSLGSANSVYVSIPDPMATSTAGDQCQGLGLPILPALYVYQCAASSTYRKVDGTGWIPINFQAMSFKSPLGALPIDPINTSSSRSYYTYTTNGSQYEVTSVMESQKYKLGGANDVISTDGGTLASVYEKGTKTGLEPLDYGDTSLVGLWTLTEGTGTVAYDFSGNNATGSWNGTQMGSNGYYSAGQMGLFSGTFDGVTDFVSIANNSSFNVSTLTTCAWIDPSSFSSLQNIFSKLSGNPSYEQFGIISNPAGLVYFQLGNNAGSFAGALSLNTWSFVCGAANGTIGTLYINGQPVGTFTYASTYNAAYPFRIGNTSYSGNSRYFSGLIAHIRIYNRALSTGEITAMYNGGK